jgi:hypothetical protein
MQPGAPVGRAAVIPQWLSWPCSSVIAKRHWAPPSVVASSWASPACTGPPAGQLGGILVMPEQMAMADFLSCSMS